MHNLHNSSRQLYEINRNNDIDWMFRLFNDSWSNALFLV